MGQQFRWVSRPGCLDLVLGTLAAGMIVAWLPRDAQTHVLHQKLDGIGVGSLVPVVFINSEMTLDVQSVFASSGGIKVSLLFFIGIVLAHIPVALQARASMSGKESSALGLLSVATLSLIVAGVLSVTLMSLLDKALLPKGDRVAVSLQDKDGL